ncbi:MAG TPA: SDR family oxidoreductase [Gemmatimonadales bacterium]|jgi:3-oxoacyl-[acyl-carrier protein] reductase|nr:SDR family oxidoreductase [Gemmatimonadales bacterium]
MTDKPTALITGATEGIGRATAFALGRAGFRVGVCARTAAKVDALLEALGAAGIEAAGRPGDVGSEADASAIVMEVEQRLGPVNVLVNNAGVLVAKRIEDVSLAEWDSTMATNVRALFLFSRLVLPGMRQRRSGTIVNVASLAGKNAFVGGTAYAASKHAVLGFSRSLMLEVRRDRVRVVAICPGSVATGMLQDQPLLAADPQKILMPEDVAATIVHAVTLPSRALVSELDIRPTDP